jgi:hypothetical protein
MARVTRRAFDRAVRATDELHERTSILGALLQRSIGPTPKLVIVGGSAIAIWTSGDYASGDIDLVGPRSEIGPILASWGFVRSDDPDGRVYWSRSDLGLFVDIIDRADYVGHSEGLLQLQTRYGPIHIAAVEDLILRRLIFWKKGHRPELLDQAVDLFSRNRQKIDPEYMAVMTRHEDIDDAYMEMQRLADASTSGRVPPAGRRSG